MLVAASSSGWDELVVHRCCQLNQAPAQAGLERAYLSGSVARGRTAMHVAVPPREEACKDRCRSPRAAAVCLCSCRYVRCTLSIACARVLVSRGSLSCRTSAVVIRSFFFNRFQELMMRALWLSSCHTAVVVVVAYRLPCPTPAGPVHGLCSLGRRVPGVSYVPVVAGFSLSLV